MTIFLCVFRICATSKTPAMSSRPDTAWNGSSCFSITGEDQVSFIVWRARSLIQAPHGCRGTGQYCRAWSTATLFERFILDIIGSGLVGGSQGDDLVAPLFPSPFPFWNKCLSLLLVSVCSFQLVHPRHCLARPVCHNSHCRTRTDGSTRTHWW